MALPATVKSNIIKQLKEGKSTRQIAQELSVSQSTVSRIRLEHCSTIACPARGRPKKLSESDSRYATRFVIVSLSLSHEFMQSKTFSDQSQSDVSDVSDYSAILSVT